MIKCRKGYTIQILKSNAGYYIGTLDDEHFPNCRISQNYFITQEHAEIALNTNSFTIRDCVENSFCNEGKSCY